jgi:hypothetical protein
MSDPAVPGLLPEPVPGRGSVGRGIGIAALLNVGGVIVGGILMMIVVGVVIVLGIGVCQLIWLLPFYFRFRNRGETETAKGILIGAGITFLLNAGCWGVVMTSLSHTSFR